jgi:hypothetical protein
MESEPVITSVLLADGVIMEHGTGKFNLIGCFNMLAAPKFPVTHPGFFAVLGITNLQGQMVKLTITIRIEDPASGHVLASTAGILQLTFLPGMDSAKMLIDLPVRFPPVVFPNPGFYSIVVLCNNEPLEKRNLFLQQVDPPPQLKPPPPQG